MYRDGEMGRVCAMECRVCAKEGRKEGTCLFHINNHNTEYTSEKFCRETRDGV